jgi:hypothetical protein
MEKSMMEIKEFATSHKVKFTLGKSGTENLIVGKFGEIAENYDADNLFRLRLLGTPRDRVMNGALNSRKKQAQSGGMTPLHVTPYVYESIWGFDPEDTRLAELAISLVQPRRKRTVVLSDDQKQALVARLASIRPNRTSIAI